MKKSRFEIFDKFYGAHWFLTGYSCRNFSELLRTSGNAALGIFIGVMENDVNSMIFDAAQFDKAGDYCANKLINNHAWRRKKYKLHEADLLRYFEMGERFSRLPFVAMTDKQILKSVKPLITLQERVRILGVMLNGLVLDGRSHLSNKLRRILSVFFKNNENFESYWPTLTQVTHGLSMRQRKNLEIARLAEQSRRMSPARVAENLEKIYKKYRWLNYMYYGPPATLQTFRNELRAALRNNSDLHLPARLKTLWRKQQAIMKRFGFDRPARNLVWLAQHVLWQKGWRKDVEYHTFYCYEPMLRELARRKKEKNWRNLLYMLPWELENFVLHDRPSLAELRKRRQFSVLIVTGPKRVRMLIGKAARELYEGLKLERDFSKVTQVTGQCAFVGKAKGTVRIVQVPEDMSKMNKGDILVSQATSPDLLPAIKKASAIVTNTGGLICHAAIISRELKIPCVVGAVNVTSVFKDGDQVEVDATSGIVKKLTNQSD